MTAACRCLAGGPGSSCWLSAVAGKLGGTTGNECDERGEEGVTGSAERAGVDENQGGEAAETVSVRKTACFGQRQGSVKITRLSILEAIWDQRTEEDASCESFCRE